MALRSETGHQHQVQKRPPAILKAGHHSAWRSLERLLFQINGFELIFLQFDDIEYRDVLIEHLRKNRDARVIDLATPRWASFAAFEAGLEKLSRKKDLIQVINLDLGNLESRDQSWLRGFNYHREALAAMKCRLIFWVRQGEIEQFTTEAPDWWAWRSVVLDFRLNNNRFLGNEFKEAKIHDQNSFQIRSFDFIQGRASGKQLRDWLQEIFEAQGLDIKHAPSTDLAFELNGQPYLVEIKLNDQPLQHRQIEEAVSLFKYTDPRAVGVIITPKGFSKKAILAASRSRPYSPMLLVDKHHLEALAGGLDVKKWLQTYSSLAERRHKACIPVEELQREIRGETRFSFDAVLSFVLADRKTAHMLHHNLSKTGFKIWFDEINLAGRQTVEQALEEALSRTRHFILILSPRSLASKWFAREINLIGEIFNPFNRERRLIPVMARECAIPPELKPYDVLDATTPEKLQRSIPEIIALLKP